jgi:hypothetical protein
MVEVPDGPGVVGLFGNGFASLLYLGGEPSRLHACDCMGSVGQLAARAAPGALSRPSTPGTTRPAELDALRDWLAAPGLDVGKPPPVEPLEPLLRLLVRGRYEIGLSTPAWRELPVLDPGPDTTRHWYWPTQGDALVVTDHWPPRDRAAVAGYRARIARGERPAAVTIRAPGGGPRYLLDGHHKLSAYQQAGARPLLIEITPERPMPLRRDEFAALVPAGGDFARALDDWSSDGPPPDGDPGRQGGQ